jgi:DNA-binding MarR family transcriptional regulator
MTSTRAEVDVAAAASELRVVLGRLVRLLRTEQGLPFAQASVLGRLDRFAPSPASAPPAAERVRPQSMAQTIADLEADGIVTRRPDPDVRRRVLVELAPRGQEALDDDRRRREGRLAEAIRAELTEEEQAVLVRAVGLLRRLAEL